MPATTFYVPAGVDHPALPSFPTRRSSDLGSPSQPLFAKSLQLTDPPGCPPNNPATDARSLNVAPTTPEPGSCVVAIDSYEDHTSELQSLRPLATPLLLATNK